MNGYCQDRKSYRFSYSFNQLACSVQQYNPAEMVDRLHDTNCESHVARYPTMSCVWNLRGVLSVVDLGMGYWRKIFCLNFLFFFPSIFAYFS